MRYNKEFIKKDGRKLISVGPRDLQRRQAQRTSGFINEETVNILTVEIGRLRKELSTVKNTNSDLFTAEQIDADISKVINETVTELTIKHDSELNKKDEEYKKNLKQQQITFKESISIKDELIIDLKTQNKFLTESIYKLKEGSVSEIANKLTTLLTEVTEKMNLNGTNNIITVESDRPKIEKIFIDPINNESMEGVETHINLKDISISEKEEWVDKVGKLKGLMGKLPNRKS